MEWGGGPAGSGRRARGEWEEGPGGVGGGPLSVCCGVGGDTGGGKVPRTGKVSSLLQTMCSGPGSSFCFCF